MHLLVIEHRIRVVELNNCRLQQHCDVRSNVRVYSHCETCERMHWSKLSRIFTWLVSKDNYTTSRRTTLTMSIRHGRSQLQGYSLYLTSSANYIQSFYISVILLLRLSPVLILMLLLLIFVLFMFLIFTWMIVLSLIHSNYLWAYLLKEQGFSSASWCLSRYYLFLSRLFRSISF
jgi:hypothetical protein